MNYTLKNFTITGLVACAVVLGPVSPAAAEVAINWKGCAKTNYASFAGNTIRKMQIAAHSKAKKEIKRQAKKMCKKKCGPTKTAKGFKKIKKGALEQVGPKNKYWAIKTSAPKRFIFECR